MKLFELFDIDVRQEIAPEGEHLTELEKHDAELLDRFTRLRRCRPVPFTAQCSEEAVPREYAEDAHDAGGGAGDALWRRARTRR